METLSRSESRRLYSWWWDSHNSPKNSKWLQDNLTDMDAKVKSIIKLIEEDADSFARRAEMYYKKRPELMKLVEEFYRAYRALAERYNHATGELRHAHRTIAKAFPDQVPLQLLEDSPSKHGPHTPDMKCPARVLFDSDDEGDSELGTSQKTGSNETQRLKKALADMVAEKEAVVIEYEMCLEKVSSIERELENANKDSMRLNEKASRAEIEVETLKEALVRLNAEKDFGLEKISNLESTLSRVQQDMIIENQSLRDERSRLELEKERMLLQNKECVEKISVLENIVLVMENEAKLLKIQAEESENEASELKKTLAFLSKEKEKSGREYKCCLETISKLEKDISNAKEDVNRLNNDVLVGNLKLKASEEKRTLLEMSNLSLRAEANNLAKKIAVKDRELSDKQHELENLRRDLQEGHFRYTQVEATLEALRNVHSHSQDDQGALVVELKNALQMLNDLDVSKNRLEEEIKQVRDENQISMENIQNEIVGLREIKERLEKEVVRHVGLSNSLQKEILRLKEEIEELNGSYRALVEQVERAGLSPKSLGPSIKSLHDENAKMKQKCEDESRDKMILLKKLENLEQLSAELESSREKTKALQESCEFLNGEKGAVMAEKASLMSQLQVITENMHNLLGKNAVLENCLSNAKVELEGLREKSKGLEEICELLKDERTYLLNEKSSLVCKLENVERKLESLEKTINGLEEKYTVLEKEKKGVDCKVEELEVYLSIEKQERKSSEIKNGSILAGLENQIHLLKEENRWKKKEYDEELDKALKAQFEISILQKFMKDMEEKNYSLVIECQKHVEASKLADKLISELESESLEQQVEAEFLLDEIERLRLGIYRVFRALNPDCDRVEKIENEGGFVDHVVQSIEDMQSSISRNENDNQMLLVENSVLLTLVEQLESKGVEIESQKMNLEKNVFELSENNSIQKKELESLYRVNTNLESKLGSLREEKSKIEMKNNEFELFESEATAFYFDLQISSSIHEVLYKSKLHEVSGVCRNLESENASKTLEIEQMKVKVCSMEREIDMLKSRLYAYGPVVDSLRDDLTFLEQNALLQAKRKVASDQEVELLEGSMDPRTSTFELLQDDESLVGLQNLQVRIKTVGKMMEEANKPVSRRRSNFKSKQEPVIGEIDKVKTRGFLGRESNKKKAQANEETPKLLKIKTKATEVWNGMRMKDIPLDQVSNCNELSKIGEDGKRIQTIGQSLRLSCEMTEKDIVYDDFKDMKLYSSPPSTDFDMEKELGVDMLEVSTRISEANKEVNKRRVLERLTSDAHKLENLQTTVQTLKMNLETSKKGKNVDFETVREQLVEAEETVVHLVDMNGELVRKLQECPTPEGRVSPRRRKVVEQARKASERIGRVQLELQKLEFIVMKMEDEKKNKGRIKFFRSKGVVLRDFIYNGKRNSVKRKKGPLCGCFKPSTSRNGRSL